MVTYEDVVEQMLLRLPELREEYDFDSLDNREVYHVFEWILIRFLEEALAAGNLPKILRTTAFFEELAVSASNDPKVENLLVVAIGEWLNSRVTDEDRLAPWLGEETKRVCGYVPGLAAQRTADRIAKRKKTLSFKLKKLAKHLFETNS